MVFPIKLGSKSVVVDYRFLQVFRNRELLHRYLYSDFVIFDNANGGMWIKRIRIPITTVPIESCQYRIVIDSTNVSVYNSQGTLKTQGAVASDFWNNVRSDGYDIRLFDQSANQLYFWIESFNYSNQRAVIWVKIPTGTSELNIAYGNPLASMSSYNNPNQVFSTVVYDPFNTLNTAFWYHRESTVGISTNYYVSSPSSLRLYYGTGSPYHADAVAQIPSLQVLIAEVSIMNRGSDPYGASDPDRGSISFRTGGYHGTGVIGTTVYPNRISYGITEANVIAYETGSFGNTWVRVRIEYLNGQLYWYRYENGVWVLKASATTSPVNIDHVSLTIAGYYHEEYFDDFYLYGLSSTDPASFGTPEIRYL